MSQAFDLLSDGSSAIQIVLAFKIIGRIFFVFFALVTFWFWWFVII